MAEKKLGILGDRKFESVPSATQPDIADLDDGKIVSTGIGLREGELRALEKIGADLGALMNAEPIARNAVMRLLIRLAIVDYRAGRLRIEDLMDNFTRPEKPQPKLKFK